METKQTADEAAESSRWLLASIVDSAEDAIISKNLDGIITSWNRGAERIFGYTPEETVGRPITMLIPEDRQDEETRILERLRRGERIEQYETIRRAKDGTLLQMSLTISPVRDGTGKIIGASKIGRNITQQRAMQERLRRSEERLRVTLDSIGDAVIATDRHGCVTFMNPVAENLTGWRQADAQGLPLEVPFKIVNETTGEPTESPVVKVLREGAVVGLANHTILLAKDGRRVPIDDSGAPIRDLMGEIIGVVLVFRDISERRASEMAAQRLAAIVNNSEDAIISKDLNGTIESWNRGAERIFGYSEEKAVGKSITMLIPPELQQEEQEILARLRRGERVDHFETTRVSQDGRLIPVSLTISPIRDAEGNVVGASKIAREISERRKAQQALVETQRRLQVHAAELERRVEERTLLLEQTIRELESFSFSLSHDMRAPLRAIESFSQIVLEDYGSRIDPPGVDLLKRVISATQRMDRLILDLMALTRLSREPTPPGRMDVENLVLDIIRERREFQAPRAMVTVDRPLLPVLGNEASLTQCITNLLDNAVKFVAHGVVPHVRVFSERRDSMVRLWFEDNGIGISAADQPRIFQMFQRLHGSEYPGTGLGLAIVRKATERMSGEAGVESEPGKGSRFWIQLPDVEK